MPMYKNIKRWTNINIITNATVLLTFNIGVTKTVYNLKNLIL